MRHLFGALLLVGLFLAMGMPALMASTEACADGTAYFACSTKQPGFACLPDAATGGNTLQNDIVNKIVKNTDGNPKCACKNYPGYTEAGGACVSTTCTDAGQTVQSNACAPTKPRQCVNGALVDNAALCACPDGSQPAADGKTCTKRSGCRWNNPACPENSECKYVESAAGDDGLCKPKQGCAFGTVTCSDMQDCDKSSNPNGVCVAKPGCKYVNPPCAKGKTCNVASNTCEDAAVGGGGDTPLLPNTQTPGANATTGGAPGGGLPCCPLPAVAAVTMIGLVAYRRARNSDAENDGKGA